MIEINLLPAQQRPRSAGLRSPALNRLPQALLARGEPWLIGLGAAGLLVVLFAGWSWWSTASVLTRLQHEVAREVADSTRNAASLAVLAAARARQDSIQQRIEILHRLDADRFLWPRLLDEISAALPPSTWLTRLSSTEAADGSGAIVVIEGASASTQLLTRFMKNLEASPRLKEVTLVTTEQIAAEDHAFNRFALEARHQAPGPNGPTHPPLTTLSR